MTVSFILEHPPHAKRLTASSVKCMGRFLLFFGWEGSPTKIDVQEKIGYRPFAERNVFFFVGVFKKGVYHYWKSLFSRGPNQMEALGAFSGNDSFRDSAESRKPEINNTKEFSTTGRNLFFFGALTKWKLCDMTGGFLSL